MGSDNHLHHALSQLQSFFLLFFKTLSLLHQQSKLYDYFAVLGGLNLRDSKLLWCHIIIQESKTAGLKDSWCTSALRRLREASPLSLKVSLRSVSPHKPLVVFFLFASISLFEF